MTRRPIIAGNWKMNNNKAMAKELTEGIVEKIKGLDSAKMPEVILAPTYTALWQVHDLIKNTPEIALSAQNVNPNKSGAYTGEISIDMLKDFGVKFVIIGHSERRQLFSETDEFINQKAIAILENGLIPIICCGETLEQREQGVTDSHLESQITKALKGISADDVKKSVIAYEPIWAIGTGKTCDAIEANRTIGEIRKVVAKLYDQSVADAIRILYGGSVKPATIKEQMAQPEIDGGLIGGASLDADSFVALIKGAM
ncbi:triose-phosphate isomerase [bacterium]|nr:triose-phosphate isomerase [bacterium]